MIINFIKPSNIFSASRLSNIKRAEYKKSAMPQLKGQPASDTVSFSGAAQLIGANMQYAPSSKICREVHENAKSPAYNLGLILQKYVSPVNNTQKNGSEPPVKLKIRVKSPSSIREKTISKFSEIERDNKRAFADAAVSEIFKYYIPEKGYTKEMAAADTKNFMEISDKNIFMPPYNNEGCLLKEILDELKTRRMITYNKALSINEQEAFNQMTADLKNITDAADCNENGTYILPDTIQGIKHYANDIAGARIILNDSDKKTVQNVLKGLKQAARDGRLKITSIENYLPDKKKLPAHTDISDYEYVQPRFIKALANSAGAEYLEKTSKSGYLAIHINLDLSDDNFKSKKNELNNFQGEIQIIGADIEKLKDIEDLCYKLKDNKNAFKAEYKPFKEHFRKYYDSCKDAFNDYTYSLYLYQRLKVPGAKSLTAEFPSIKKLGYEGRVPEELDFNILKDIKNECKKNAGTAVESDDLVMIPGIKTAFSSMKPDFSRINKIRYQSGR